MVWDGSSSWEIFKDYFIWTAVGFDANNELTPLENLKSKLTFTPSHYSMYVIRTGGATNAVDMRLQGRHSDDTGSTKELCKVTDSRGGGYTQSSTTNYGAGDVLSSPLQSHIRLFTIDVGAGNTLTVTVIGRK